MEFNNRTNILIEPTIHDGSLILVFHGGGGTPASLQTVIDLETHFPDSMICYVQGVNNVWQYDLSDNDSSYVYALIAHLKQTYPSITSIHLVGHSMGGMVVYKIAAILDEVGISSITVIAGCHKNPHNFDFEGNILHIHGDDDTTVPIEGNAVYPSLADTKAAVKANGVNNTFVEVQNVGHALSDIIAAKPDFYELLRLNMGL